MFFMRKYALFITFSAIVCVGSAAAYWLVRSDESAAAFVEQWSLSFQRAEESCRKGSRKMAFECAHWAAYAPIYNSDQFGELEEWLAPACQLGGEIECLRLQKIGAARSNVRSPWLTNVGANAPESDWPRIKFSSQAMTSSDWLNNALQGAVAGTDRTIDLFCGNLTEIDETLVCTVSDQLRLNRAIGRIVAYIEQNRRLDTYQDHMENPLNRFWQGVDLQRTDFDKTVNILRQRGQVVPEEERLWKWLESQSWQVFLAFNVYSIFTGIPSHEFLHALYFSNQEFRNAVRSVVESDISGLKNLSEFVGRLYKTPETFIISNEMQAYLFEYRSSFRDTAGERVIAQILDALPLSFDHSLITQLQQGY